MKRLTQTTAAATPLQGKIASLAAALLLTVVCAVVFPNTAHAFELNSTSGAAADNYGYSYTFDSTTGALSLVSVRTANYEAYFSGEVDTSFKVPEKIGGVSVTSVAWASGSVNTAIKTVEFPKTITSFGVEKFTGLEEISFYGDGDFALTSLGRETGAPYCTRAVLKSFNAQTIDGVYYDCVIPDGVTTFIGDTFYGADFDAIYIPASVKQVVSGTNNSYGTLPFSNHANLTTIYNASDLWLSFNECPNVVNYTITGNPTEMGSCRGMVNLPSIDIPDSATEIPSNALQGCSSLKEVDLPDSITSIGSMAFAGCSSLESVTYQGENLLSIGSGAFNGSAITSLTLPDTITFIGHGAFANTGIEELVIPPKLWEGLTCGEGGNFNKDPSIWTLTAGGVTTYGANLFCDDTSDVVNYGGPGIGMYKLVNSSYWNTSLKSIDLMSYQQSYIPYYMFAGLAGIEEIRIPATVSKIYEGAFADCVNLNKAYLYNQSPDVAGSASTSDTGSSNNDEGGWTEYYPSAFGVHTHIDEDDPNTTVIEYAQEFSVRSDLTLYGVGFSQNSLIAYAEKYGCEFIPFAFLGEGGSSQTVVDLFGYAMPANTVSVSSTVQPGETPTITLGYQDAEVSRTLIPGTDCTVTYTLNGVAVSDTYTPGVYTATITGDDDSVWGTTTATFSVEAPEGIDIPVSSTTGVTGVTASGSLYGSNIPDGGDCSVELIVDEVTEGETFEALKGSMGEGIFGGIFEVTLLINGEEVHDNFGTLTINFPVDAQYNGHWVTIYHLHSNGTISSERVLVQNGIAALTVSDLSTFGLEIGELANSNTNPDGNNVAANTTQASASTAADTLAKTGDSLPVMPLAVGGAVAFATSIVALVLLRRRLA